jgi:Protein of unknown function (DUF3703)
MGFVIGSVLALAVGIFATRVGLDRGRTFYATVTIVIASYYVLFAAMGGSSRALLSECVVMIPFVIAAVTGFKRAPWLLVLAMTAHGALDMVHPALIDNAGVPLWWPDFCCAYDVVAAGYLAALLARVTRSPVPPAFWTAVAAARSCMSAADYHEAMRQLERAHVLGQRYVGPHLRVHRLMLQVELCRRSPSAALGQLARLFFGALGNAIGLLPTGNRGSSAVSMFREEPIPAELALLMGKLPPGRRNQTMPPTRSRALAPRESAC